VRELERVPFVGEAVGFHRANKNNGRKDMRKITTGTLVVACSMALAVPAALAQDSTTKPQGGPSRMPIYTPNGKVSTDPSTGAPVGEANPAPGNGTETGTTGAAPVTTGGERPAAPAANDPTNTRHDPPGTRTQCRGGCD
jgi:hypothetical protein